MFSYTFNLLLRLSLLAKFTTVKLVYEETLTTPAAQAGHDLLSMEMQETCRWKCLVCHVRDDVFEAAAFLGSVVRCFAGCFLDTELAGGGGGSVDANACIAPANSASGVDATMSRWCTSR